MPLALSIIVTCAGSVPYAFLTTSSSINWLVYPLAMIQGVGIAMMLNTSTSLISDVIGTESESSAFVYGIYSFMDKMANGILLYFLVANYSTSGLALRLIVTIVPCFAAIFTTLLTWIGLLLYPEKMAKISAGSYLNSKKKVTPMERKSSVPQIEVE